MKRLFRSVAAVMALAAVALSTAVFAQQTESRITGRVLDDSKAAMPGVTVTVTSKSTGTVRTAITGGDGDYTVTNLSPGAYTVASSCRGLPTRRAMPCSGSASSRPSTRPWASRRCRKQ